MIDSHCHLDHEPLFTNLDDILIRSKNIGIQKLLTICTTLESFEKIKKIVKKDEIIFGTYGIHPHEVKDNKITSEQIINEINNNEKIIGIGETGLDFFYNHSEKNDQIKSFETHIKASIDLKIPIIIHSRNAEIETYEVLKKYKDYDLKILMHCFTGSKEFNVKMRADLLERGMTLNEHSLKDTETKKPVNHKFVTEEDIFSYLGMEYVHPCDR